MVFEKLYKFVGKNIKNLVDRPDEPYCFRLQKNRVYYVRESLMKKATNVSGVAGAKGRGVHGSGWRLRVLGFACQGRSCCHCPCSELAAPHQHRTIKSI